MSRQPRSGAWLVVVVVGITIIRRTMMLIDDVGTLRAGLDRRQLVLPCVISVTIFSLFFFVLSSFLFAFAYGMSRKK